MKRLLLMGAALFALAAPHARAQTHKLNPNLLYQRGDATDVIPTQTQVDANANAAASAMATANAALPAAKVGAAGGAAPLDSGLHVPVVNIPPLSHTQITDFGSAAAAAAPVQTVAGRSGAVSLTHSDVSDFTASAAAAAPVQSVAGLTGAPTATQIATTQQGLTYSGAKVLTAPVNSGAAAGTVLQTFGAKEGERISIGDFGGSTASETTAQAAAVTAISTAGGGVIYYPSGGSTGWNKSHNNTPSNMSYEMDGPAIHYEQMIGIGDTEMAFGKAWIGTPPQGATEDQSLLGCAINPLGQGTTGTANGDSCFSIRVVKQNFATTTIPGSSNGLNIFVKGGGPSTFSNDTYAYNTFVEGGYQSGFIQQSENLVEELGSDNSTIAHQTDVQQQVMDDQGGANSYYGFNMTANIGTNISAFRFVGSGINRWGNILQNSYGSIQNYWVTDTGNVEYSSDGTTATRFIESDVNGIWELSNATTALVTVDQSGVVSIPALHSVSPLATNGSGQITAGSGIVETDNFSANGTWTKNPAATWITAYIIGGGSSGAGGPTATAGTAYSGGGGGSAGSAIIVSGPSTSFSSGSVSVCGVATGGVAGSIGNVGGVATWNGYTAFGGGVPSAGGTIASASGGSAGAQGSGGAASGTTAGSAGSVFGAAGISAAAGTTSSTPQIGSSGGGTALSGAGNNAGSSLSAPSGGGSGAGMAATQALLVGGTGGFVSGSTRPAGGASAGAAGGNGTNLPQGYGTGGGGGANNIAGIGGTGGTGGLGAGGGGGGAGSTGGGAGGSGGGCFVRVVQQ